MIQIKLRLVMLSLVCLVAASGCASETESLEASNASLRETDKAIQKAIREKNLEKIVSFYAEDAKLLPTAKPQINGKAAIRAEWEAILKIPDFSNTSEMKGIEMAKGADLAYTTGIYTATMMGEDGKLISEPGKWISVWKRQTDGSWKIIMDIYNTDIPPPDHK